MCSLDLVPDNIIGCSLGELVCAYADGCLSFEETLSAAFYCAAFLTSQYRNGDGVMSVLAGKLAEHPHIPCILICLNLFIF